MKTRIITHHFKTFDHAANYFGARVASRKLAAGEIELGGPKGELFHWNDEGRAVVYGEAPEQEPQPAPSRYFVRQRQRYGTSVYLASSRGEAVYKAWELAYDYLANHAGLDTRRAWDMLNTLRDFGDDPAASGVTVLCERSASYAITLTTADAPAEIPHGFKVTYETWPPFAVECGEPAARGFITRGSRLSHALDDMGLDIHGLPYPRGCIEADEFPVTCPRWFSRTHGEDSYSLHVPEHITPASRRRIARLLGAI